jgi:hypothetical protein
MTASSSLWRRERTWLGYAGLVPFVAGLGVILLAGRPAWEAAASDAVRHYAAVIASFLGAVHWGVAAGGDDGLRRARLRWGVTPALIAWVLLALPTAAALGGFAALFLLILVVDTRLLPVPDDDYRALRLRLSLVVVTVLLLAAMAAA